MTVNQQFRDQLAVEAWGVLIAAGVHSFADANNVAHAIVGNLLPLVAAERRRFAAEELELVALLTVSGEDAPQDIREALFDRAAALRAEECTCDHEEDR